MKVIIKNFFTSIFKSSIFLGILYFSKIPFLIWASKILFFPLFITCCTDLIKNASKKQAKELNKRHMENVIMTKNNVSSNTSNDINYLKEVKKSLGNSDQLNKSKVLKKTKV